VLKSEEEKDYLIRVHDDARSKASFSERSGDSGKLYLLSDLHEEPERIYGLHKQREYVGYAFNVYKNDLEVDRSYLREDHMLFTYMFLNLLSLYLDFQILNLIEGKYSVRDILLILSRIKMYGFEKKEMMSVVPKKAK
jgi:transposase